MWKAANVLPPLIPKKQARSTVAGSGRPGALSFSQVNYWNPKTICPLGSGKYREVSILIYTYTNNIGASAY